MVNRPGADNPLQKGRRRQKLHKDQNNVGDPKKKSDYKNFNGEPAE